MSGFAKLRGYLELVDKVRPLAKHIADEVSKRLHAEPTKLSLRERVLIGLALKMYSSFECLVEDGRVNRSGAMHHLKTLMETFVYFHWVGQDTGDMRAKLVFAKGLHRKTVFFEKNIGYAEESTHRSWTQSFEEAIRGLETEWKGFKDRSLEKLAEETGQSLAQWYNRVYRLACEPAHITDLAEYMPLPGKPIHIGETPTSRLWADIALDYGLYIILDVLKNSSDLYELGLGDKIADLLSKHSETRMLPSG